ncbi:MAG: hypothetical protein JO142_14775 [Burkholderiales bacterium]|nr:hypothetical protein [Burkholderiales bacterium]
MKDISCQPTAAGHYLPVENDWFQAVHLVMPFSKYSSKARISAFLGGETGHPIAT